MRIVIQRVKRASVTINNQLKTSINEGLLILLGIELSDTKEDINWLVRKVINLRIFNDETSVMNRSILESDGAILLVSQFTLHASSRKGNRPSYIRAARPEIAIPLYEEFIATLEIAFGKKVETGEFGANMEVALVNDGPVTIIIDSLLKE